jgi:hypothetical protein
VTLISWYAYPYIVLRLISGSVADPIIFERYSATRSEFSFSVHFFFPRPFFADLELSSHRGNLAWTQALQWVGQNEYVLAKEKTYKTLDGKKAGITRSVGKGAGLFRWLQLDLAGHMVPKGAFTLLYRSPERPEMTSGRKKEMN